jgi:hypothetical protein
MSLFDLRGARPGRRALFLLLLLSVAGMLATIARVALPMLWPLLRPVLRLLA